MLQPHYKNKKLIPCRHSSSQKRRRLNAKIGGIISESADRKLNVIKMVLFKDKVPSRDAFKVRNLCCTYRSNIRTGKNQRTGDPDLK